VDAAPQRALEPEETDPRRAALREAGLRLWADTGWASVTAEAVCAATGLTPQDFAAEYTSRDELLADVFDEATNERAAVVLGAMEAAGGSLHARVHAVLTAVADVFAEDPRQSAVMVQATGSPVLMARRRAASRGFASIIANELSRAPLPVEPHRLYAAAHFCLGGLAELILAWQDEGTPVDRDLLVEHGTRLLEACLTAR